MKNAYFSKKIIKNIKADRQLGIYDSPLGKKHMFCHWECLLLLVVTIWGKKGLYHNGTFVLSERSVFSFLRLITVDIMFLPR